MKRLLTLAALLLATASAFALAQLPERLERRGMMGCGGMMGGSEPNEQWRSPESGR